jgi:hypothetical protein
MARIERARTRLIATGEVSARSGGGRAPRRSDRYKAARAELHAARQARNRLLVELVGDADAVPFDLPKRLGLSGRDAASVLHSARTGSKRVRELVLGRLSVVE